MQHFSIFRQRNAARGFNRPPYIIALNISGLRAYRNSAATIQSAHMDSRNAYQRRLDRHIYNRFGLFNRAPNRTERKLQIDDLAFAPALRFGCAECGKLHAAFFFHLANQRAGFGAAHIERHHITVFLRQFRRSLLSSPGLQPSAQTDFFAKCFLSRCWAILFAVFPAGFRWGDTVAAPPPDLCIGVCCAALVFSGFTTASRLNRRSTDSTRPAVARHCPMLSSSVRYLPSKLLSPKCTSSGLSVWPQSPLVTPPGKLPPGSPVRVARKSSASERSTSLTCSVAPGCAV